MCRTRLCVVNVLYLTAFNDIMLHCRPCCCCVYARTLPSQPAKGINHHAFDDAWRAYALAMADVRKGIRLLIDTVCPACSDGCNAIHIDGNLKLFVWERLRELWCLLHCHDFFIDSGAAQLTLAVMDKARVRCCIQPAHMRACSDHTDAVYMPTCLCVCACSRPPVAALMLLTSSARACGQQPATGRRAAAARPPSSPSPGASWVLARHCACTLPIAPCMCSLCCHAAAVTDARHGVPFLAVNQAPDHGERYAYFFHLLLELMQRGIVVHQVHIDFNCKWSKWLDNQVAALQKDPPASCTEEEAQHHLCLRAAAAEMQRMRLVLPEAHGALHSIYCQVRLHVYTHAHVSCCGLHAQVSRIDAHACTLLSPPPPQCTCRSAGSPRGLQAAARRWVRRGSSCSPPSRALRTPRAT